MPTTTTLTVSSLSQLANVPTRLSGTMVKEYLSRGQVESAPKYPHIMESFQAMMATSATDDSVVELASAQDYLNAKCRLQQFGIKNISDTGNLTLQSNVTFQGPGLLTSSGFQPSFHIPKKKAESGGMTLYDWTSSGNESDSVIIAEELDLSNKTITIMLDSVSCLWIIARRLKASGAVITYAPQDNPLTGPAGLDATPSPADPNYDQAIQPGYACNDPSAAGGDGSPGGAGGQGPAGLAAADLKIYALEIDAMPDIILPGQKGGKGGPGGRGADGGQGQRGRDSHSTYFDCRSGPGTGGRGGRGGDAGQGGKGGPGGLGAHLYFYTQESSMSQFITARQFTQDNDGGQGGEPGLPGYPGNPGPGGLPGAAYGWCGDAPDRVGASGPFGSDRVGDLGRGDNGPRGKVGYYILTEAEFDPMLDQPWIASADPTSGFAGASVTLNGFNFSNALTGQLVVPGSANPPISLATTFVSNQQITVKIPGNAPGGRLVICLEDAAGNLSNGVPFAVRPKLTAVQVGGQNASSVYAEDQLHLLGTSFDAHATVSVNGKTMAAQFNSAAEIVLTLPRVKGLDPGGPMPLIVTNPDGLASDPLTVERLPVLDSGFRASVNGFAFHNFSAGQNVGLDTYAATFGADEVALETFLNTAITGAYYAFYHWYLTNNGHCTALSALSLDRYYRGPANLFADGPDTRGISPTPDPPNISADLMQRIDVAQGRVISRDLMWHYADQSNQGIDRVEATVREIEAGLGGGLGGARVLCFIPSGSDWQLITDAKVRAALSDGHCVVPTKIQYPDAARSLDGARLFVYDCNCVGDDGRYIRLFLQGGKLSFQYDYSDPAFTFSPATSFTLGTATLQAQLYDDVDVPFVELEVGAAILGFIVELVLSPAFVSVSDASGRVLGYRDGKVHANTQLGWVRPGLEQLVLVRADANATDRIVTGTAAGTYTYASLHPGNRAVMLADVPCSATTRDQLKVEPGLANFEFTPSEGKTASLQFARLGSDGVAQNLTVSLPLQASQTMAVQADTDMAGFKITAPADAQLTLTARRVRDSEVLEEQTAQVRAVGGKVDLPAQMWSDLTLLWRGQPGLTKGPWGSKTAASPEDVVKILNGAPVNHATVAAAQAAGAVTYSVLFESLAQGQQPSGTWGWKKSTDANDALKFLSGAAPYTTKVKDACIATVQQAGGTDYYVFYRSGGPNVRIPKQFNQVADSPTVLRGLDLSFKRKTDA